MVSFVANLTPRTVQTSLIFGTGKLRLPSKDVLAKHEASIMHREVPEHKHACHVVKVCGGIKEAKQGQAVLRRDSIIGAMKCLYWLCKHKISHNFLIPPCK